MLRSRFGSTRGPGGRYCYLQGVSSSPEVKALKGKQADSGASLTGALRSRRQSLLCRRLSKRFPAEEEEGLTWAWAERAVGRGGGVGGREAQGRGAGG